MSFTVEDKKVDIDLNKIPAEVKNNSYLMGLLDGNNFNGPVMERTMSLAEKGPGYSDKKLDKVEDIDLEFAVVTNGNQTRINYKIVETSGPVLGFLGVYFDTQSGYVLMSKDKKRKFIPAFNFYRYMRAYYNVEMNPELMTSLIEKFKMSEKVTDDRGDLHEIRLDDMVGIINKHNTPVKSNIYKLLNQSGTDKESTLSNGDELLEPFHKIVAVMNGLQSSMKSITSNYGSRNVLETYNYIKDSDASNFLHDFQGMAKLSGTVNEALYVTYNIYSGSKSKEESENHVFRNLSSMIHSDSGNNSFNIHLSSGDSANRGRNFTFEDFNKTESRVLNLHDIVEEREDNSIVELDNVIMKASENVSKKEIRAVEEKIGVKEYISGATLAHFSKGLKNATSEIQAHINSLYTDIEGVGNTIAYDAGASDLVRNIKVMGRYFRRVAGLIDKVVR